MSVLAVETQATWLKYIIDVSRAQRQRGSLFSAAPAAGCLWGGRTPEAPCFIAPQVA